MERDPAGQATRYLTLTMHNEHQHLPSCGSQYYKLLYGEVGGSGVLVGGTGW